MNLVKLKRIIIQNSFGVVVVEQLHKSSASFILLTGRLRDVLTMESLENLSTMRDASKSDNQRVQLTKYSHYILVICLHVTQLNTKYCRRTKKWRRQLIRVENLCRTSSTNCSVMGIQSITKSTLRNHHTQNSANKCLFKLTRTPICNQLGNILLMKNKNRIILLLP